MMAEKVKTKLVVRLGPAVLLAGLALVLMGSEAGAVRREPGMKVTGAAPSQTRTFPALTGTTPNEGTSITNHESCGRPATTFCDIVQVDIDPQGKYDLYHVLVTLTWPNAKTNTNSAGNDLNVSVWQPEPTDPQQRRIKSTSGGNQHPETLDFAEASDPDPSTYHLVTINRQGVNQGYTIKVEIVKDELPELPALPDDDSKPAPISQPSSGGSSGSISPSTAGGDPFSDLDLGGAGGRGGPRATPRKVLVPGPDGTLIEQTLPVLARRTRTGSKDGGLNPILFGVVGVLVAANVAGGFYLVRRRRLAAPGGSSSGYSGTFGNK